MIIDRRELFILGGGLVIGGTLAACSRPGVKTSASKSVDYWTFFQNAGQQKYFQKHFVDDYRGSTPVKIVVKSTDTIDRLTQAALAAGKGPGIVLAPGPSLIAAYNRAGYLADLTKYSEKYKWNDAFASWALEASKVGGKLVTLPISYESMVFYFDPAVLQKNGLQIPKNREGFEAFCSESKGKGLVPLAAGNADWKGANEWHVTVALNHYAGPEAVYSALTGKTPWTDPVFVDAIALLSSYFQKGWYGGGVKTYFTNQFPKMYKQLGSGEAAGMIAGTWEFTNLPTYFGAPAGNSATWDWATLPSLRDGVPEVVWDLGIGASAGVNAKADNIDAAAEYLNFLTTDKKTISAAVADINWQPSPIKFADSDFSTKADARVTRLYKELAVAKTIGYTTWTFWPQKTETYIITEFEKVITNQLSPKDYCAGIQERFSKEFSTGQVPTAPKPGGVLS